MRKPGICKHCRTEFIKLRNPNQMYCAAPICQRERKNAWRREKLRGDIDYSANQRASNQRWQSKNPGYWKNYRLSHPDYVQRNREAQRVRDATGSGDASHLAKSDASSEEILIGSGSYWLMAAGDDLAKSDALKVKITVITDGYHNALDLAKSPPYSRAG